MRKLAAGMSAPSTVATTELTKPDLSAAAAERIGGSQITTDTQDRGAVIVTGASRGIGAPIAELLGGDGCGMIVNYARPTPDAS